MQRSELERQICELVRQFAPFVHACAMRQTHGDAHLADDVTQAVFILLSRKLSSLRNPAAISTWLFKTTRYAAANALRVESRRRRHERLAARLRQESEQMHDTSIQLELQPALDDAIASLRSSDRAAVLLSFFDNNTSRELGESLGISEVAARKRLSRAIEKLRTFFLKRGMVVHDAAMTAALGTALRGVAPTATIELAKSAAIGAIHGASGSSAPMLIVKGVNHMIAVAKLKLAACIAACALLGGATIITTAIAQSKTPATQPAHVATQAGAAKFDDGVTIEVAGLCKLSDAEKWWSADGASIDAPCDAPAPDTTSGSLAMYLRVIGVPDDAGIEWMLPPNTWSSQAVTEHGEPVDHGQIYTFNPNQVEIELSCQLASGEWQTVAESEGADNSHVGSDDNGSYAITATGEREGKALVNASYNIPDNQVRVIAVDSHGVERTGKCIFSGGTKSFAMVTLQFDFAPADLAKVILQKRPYDHVVHIKGVTTDPSKKTKVEVEANKK